jgi:hypothetical protein
VVALGFVEGAASAISVTIGSFQSFCAVSSARTDSAAARCAGDWQKITDRYCVPTSLPWRSLVVGSWIVKKTARRSRNDSTEGSKVTRTTSAWPVRPLHTSSYVGFGFRPPA